MPVKSSQHFLRYVLWADAISCLACGLLQVTLTSILTVHLGLSQALLSGTGVFLLLWSAMVAFFATRAKVPNTLVGFLILGNIGWALLATGLLLEGDPRLTVLGKGYIVAQILTVLILAQLQYFCFRTDKAARLASARPERQSE